MASTNAGVASGHDQALLGVLQNGLDLFTCDAGEPLQKIVNPCAILQVCKEGLRGNSRTSENPGPADPFRNSLDRWALVPIKHERRLGDPTNARQAGRILREDGSRNSEPDRARRRSDVITACRVGLDLAQSQQARAGSAFVQREIDKSRREIDKRQRHPGNRQPPFGKRQPDLANDSSIRASASSL